MKWHKGPPPSIGWWPASVSGDPDATRWWDGKRWSEVAFDGYSAAEVETTAKTPVGWIKQPYIQWQHRPESWPERSKT
jgi:hypothetical protein